MDLFANSIFRSMTKEEATNALSTLTAGEHTYEKGAVIFHAGTLTDRMGLVLSGSITIESNDFWGNRTILNHAEEGDIFAETYAILPNAPMLVDVVANEDCRILFLSIDRLLRVGAPAAARTHADAPAPSSGTAAAREPSHTWQSILLQNLLQLTAQKNLALSGRSFHTAPKTIRGRVMSYLNAMALQLDAPEFDIPFDRQQLADYLNLDRSALSKELGRMRDEGILSFRKNHFLLHDMTAVRP